ncbi:MAG: DCC1-like thiol-disulfide oxidoreductase family protein [Prolixibacteraceae bacterium]
MDLPAGKSLILFDGYCHMCSRLVRFILKYDRKAIFLFASLESPVAHFWKERCLIPETVDSVVLIEKETCLIKSEAILSIARGLGGVFRLLAVFRILPGRWRDGIYDLIARNRFRWFGRRESCLIPPKEERERFI